MVVLLIYNANLIKSFHNNLHWVIFFNNKWSELWNLLIVILTREIFLFRFSDEYDFQDSCISALFLWSFEVFSTDWCPGTANKYASSWKDWQYSAPGRPGAICTCFNCLSSFLDLEDRDYEWHAVSVATDIEVASTPTSTDDVEDESDPSISDEELNAVVESVLDSECFPIKGATWEDRYQEGMKLNSASLNYFIRKTLK